MKKLGITLSAITMVVTLMSFRSENPPSVQNIGIANQSNLSEMAKANTGEVEFVGLAVRTAIAVGRYTIAVSKRMTPMVDCAVKTCWAEAKPINTKVSEDQTISLEARIADLG